VRLLVGLGNPGPQYRDTRHNVGFWVADEIARRWGLRDNWRERFDALIVRGTAAGEPVMLAKPLTFMNLSGFAVSKLAQYFQIEPADTLVIVDEVALPLGRLRARRSGSAGGHNGLKSIVEQLGTSAFPRLRLGVGRGDERRDLADYVTSKFEPAERATMEAAVLRAADAAEMYVADGIERVMNTFNAAADKQQEDGV
jgi:peptidyl-tRNA hydrolase, PTH1 family